MGQIPGVKAKPWYSRELPLELLLVASGVAVGALGIFSAPAGWKQYAHLGVGALLAVSGIVRILRAHHKDQTLAKLEDPGELAGCLHVLYAILASRLGIAKPGTIRLTIYRVVPSKKDQSDPEQLEQVVDYVGGSGGAKGRKHSKKAGIIGRVARTGDVCWDNRDGDTPEACLKSLMKNWGYSKEEAKAISEDRVAWLGVPIYGQTEAQVIGVLFADSDRADVFEDESVRNAIVVGATGIAAFSLARYH